MNIGIVGLGLIGGSIAKTIRKNTTHRIFGGDIQPSVILKAKVMEAIDDELTAENFAACDLLILALYPDATIDFLRRHADDIKPGTTVVDCCGIKKSVCDVAFPLAREKGFVFIGGHPMAGIERSGFAYSSNTLFSNASMILVPDPLLNITQMDEVKKLFLAIGFAQVKISTPTEHDRIIAYTSQLAHIVSSSYIKSDTALSHPGFSAGSFKDMTRVATLHEGMWTELFLHNQDYLVAEIDGLVQRLLQYRDAIATGEVETLRQLLKDGRERKALVNSLELNP
ncbi:MAG: prephenate dehydrogenase [Lentisphaerae bacterium]|jgi:prephenate dehydrogenase|nr:prephenate dehydrogenase [Lentisphaerota bacterium]